MQTRLHSSHETTVSIHGMARIEVAADALLRDDGEPAYWQELRFYDAEDVSLGLVTLFLARPGVALPVGNWIKNPYTKKCGMAQHIKDGLKGKPFQLWDFPFINYWGVPQYIYFKGVPIKNKDGKVERLLCIIEETTDRVKANAS